MKPGNWKRVLVSLLSGSDGKSLPIASENQFDNSTDQRAGRDS